MARPTKERETELIARKILEICFFGAEVRRHETTSGQSEYDYDVVQNGDIIAAVEVTATTWEPEKRLIAQLESCGYRIQPGKLRKSWHVFLAFWIPGVSKISEELIDCLAQFENHAITWFIAETSFSETSHIQELYDKARGLGIKWARCSPSEQPAITMLPAFEEVFQGSEDYANPTVQCLACKEDNRKKLGASSASRRILFIVVDEMTDYPLWKQMCEFSPPKNPPQLPREVTEIWMSSRCPSGSFIVWRCQPPNGWEKLGFISPNL